MFKLIMIIMLVTGSGDLNPQMDIREMGEFDTQAECMGVVAGISSAASIEYGKKAYEGWYDSQVPKLHVTGKCVQTRSASAPVVVDNQSAMIEMLRNKIKVLEKGNGAKW